MTRARIKRLKVLPETKDALLKYHGRRSVKNAKAKALAVAAELMASLNSFSQERKAPSRTSSNAGAQ